MRRTDEDWPGHEGEGDRLTIIAHWAQQSPDATVPPAWVLGRNVSLFSLPPFSDALSPLSLPHTAVVGGMPLAWAPDKRCACP